MRLIAPAYGYPGNTRPLWDSLAGATDVIGHIIINPGSGPGSVRDPVWLEQVSALSNLGVPMLGYLNLDYSSKPIEVLLAEAARWQKWYGLLDLFLDCASSSDVRHTGIVAEILRSRARAGELVANAGTRSAPDVARHFDAVVEHEGLPPFADVPISGTWEDAGAGPGRASLGTSRAWIVYGADVGAAAVTVESARAMGVEEIWVTDHAGANPYRDLPTYWPTLLEMMQASGR